MGLLNHLRIAGLGLAIGFSMVLRDTYPSLSTESSLLGSPGQPLINRIVDYLSFFTIWSNIVVAIVAGYFVYRPVQHPHGFKPSG